MSATAPIDATGITRASRSNLAFAFACLPERRRRDMTTFYAFCRVVDDIADDPAMLTEEKRSKLESWAALVEKRQTPRSGLETEVMQLLERYPGIDPSLLREISPGDGDGSRRGPIPGPTMNLNGIVTESPAAVGLVSIEIFGARTLEGAPLRDRIGACPATDQHHPGRR